MVWHTFAMSQTSTDKNHQSDNNKAELTGLNTDAKSPAPDTGGADAQCNPEDVAADSLPKEIGGRDGPDPTRFGDWEKAGRCIDF